MRVPVVLALATLVFSLLAGSAAALGVGAHPEALPVFPLNPTPSAPPAAALAPVPVEPAALAAAASLPQVAGASDLVGRVAGLVAAEEFLGPEELGVLVAEQQLKAAVHGLRPTWSLARLVPDAPLLPIAEVAPATPLASLASPEARVAATTAGALGVSGLLSLALGRLPVLPLYTRIAREETMLNRRRAEMYDIVRREPGIHLSDLVRHTGLGWGAALYHLSVLEKQRVVVVRNEGGFKRYFANGAHHPEEMPRLTALRHAAAKALFDAVAGTPGRSARELRDLARLSPSSLARATDRLETAGLIRRERVGRRMLYYPVPGAAPPAVADAPAIVAAA